MNSELHFQKNKTPSEARERSCSGDQLPLKASQEAGGPKDSVCQKISTVEESPNFLKLTFLVASQISLNIWRVEIQCFSLCSCLEDYFSPIPKPVMVKECESLADHEKLRDAREQGGSGTPGLLLKMSGVESNESLLSRNPAEGVVMVHLSGGYILLQAC